MIYKSNGKILLTAEYLVLKGAKALALPVKLGQQLHIEETTRDTIDWQTSELNNNIFHVYFNAHSIEIIETNDAQKATYIQSLLKAARHMNNAFIAKNKGYNVKANIEFNMQWGLGTSSTLINNIAQWAQVDAYKLNNLISKGSGYDIACASENQAIVYQLANDKPIVKKVEFNPNFIDHLNLVHLNKKMPTEDNIKLVLNRLNNKQAINEISTITEHFLSSTNLFDFIELLEKHEGIISSLIGKEPVKFKLFKDFNGGIKSLGAWGGDFVLAASEMNYKEQQFYFNNKGYKTVIPLKNLLF